MAFLNDAIRSELEARLKDLPNPVRIINFTQKLECQFCSETRTLMEEVASICDGITLEVYNFQVDAEKVREYSIDKIPATVVQGERDYGIRFYGIPSGYEFAALIEAIEMVGNNDSGLSDATRAKLAELPDPVHLQVFVTPT